MDLAENEINAELYYKNKDPKTFHNIVPISAQTGEGLPDLIALISKRFKTKKMTEPLYGFILDKRHDSKYGDYYVCIHKKGILTKGDKINIDGGFFTVKRLLDIKDQKENDLEKYVYFFYLSLAFILFIKRLNFYSID